MSKTAQDILERQVELLREAAAKLQRGGDPQVAALDILRAAGFVEAVVEEAEAQA